MPKHAPIIILGNGGAACHAAMALRAAGYTDDLQMISDRDEAAFNPMLGPYYLKGRISWDQCYPFRIDFYRRYGIECRFGSPVQSLDAANRKIECKDGSTYTYHRCLVATGAAPSIPPVPGLQESSKALAVRSSRSIRKMEAAMANAKRLVVLGASLVGLKLAEIMNRQGTEVLLVDVTDQVMPRGAHPITASFIQKYMQQQGISVRLGCSLEGLEDEGSGVCCFFPGDILERTDFIAVCTGIQPSIAFLDRQHVAVDKAILIDEYSRTSVRGLYAAGDCAQGINPMSGKQEWLGTWGNACYQGRAAGMHLAGKSAAYRGSLPQHVSPVFDWMYVQIGDACRQGENIRVETHGDPFKGSFRLLVFNGDVLVGANLINDVQSISELKKRILSPYVPRLRSC